MHYVDSLNSGRVYHCHLVGYPFNIVPVTWRQLLILLIRGVVRSMDGVGQVMLNDGAPYRSSWWCTTGYIKTWLLQRLTFQDRLLLLEVPKIQQATIYSLDQQKGDISAPKILTDEAVLHRKECQLSSSLVGKTSSWKS